jgi:Ulp1 family protease
VIPSRIIGATLGKGFFSINSYDNHWILIVVNNIVKQVMAFDSLAVSNQYHAGMGFNLVKNGR